MCSRAVLRRPGRLAGALLRPSWQAFCSNLLWLRRAHVARATSRSGSGSHWGPVLVSRTTAGPYCALAARTAARGPGGTLGATGRRGAPAVCTAGVQSVHPVERPAAPCVSRVVQRRQAEAADDAQVEAGQIMHPLDVGTNRVHPPMAALWEGDEAGFVETGRPGVDVTLHGVSSCTQVMPAQIIRAHATRAWGRCPALDVTARIELRMPRARGADTAHSGPARRSRQTRANADDSHAMHTPEPRLPGVSTRQAAIILGTSESDIRRRIKRGELAAESIPRPGGTLLRVLLDDAIDAPGAAPTPEVFQSAPTPEALQDAPALTMRLLETVSADRETIREQAETIADLNLRLGRAEAASEAASTRASTLQAEIDRLRARPGWRSWWPW